MASSIEADNPTQVVDGEEETVVQKGKRHRTENNQPMDSDVETLDPVSSLPMSPDMDRRQKSTSISAPTPTTRMEARPDVPTPTTRNNNSPSPSWSDDISMITEPDRRADSASIIDNDDLDAWPSPIEGEQDLYAKGYSSPFPGVPCATVAAYMRNRKGQTMYINRAGPRRVGWYFLSDTPAPIEHEPADADVHKLLKSRSPNLQLISDQTTRTLDASVSQLAEKPTKKSIQGLLGVVVVSFYDNEAALIQSLDPAIVKRAREYDTVSKRTKKARTLPKGSPFFQRYPTTYVLVQFQDGTIKWETSSAYRSIHGRDAIRAEFNIFHRARHSWTEFRAWYRSTLPDQYALRVSETTKQEPDTDKTQVNVGKQHGVSNAPLSERSLAVLLSQLAANPDVARALEQQLSGRT